jgi:hypothetical protein
MRRKLQERQVIGAAEGGGSQGGNCDQDFRDHAILTFTGSRVRNPGPAGVIHCE